MHDIFFDANTMKLSREKEAISAYLKLLKSKGASTNVLYKRAVLLDALALKLQSTPLARASYSHALHQVMKNLPPDTLQENLNTGREFYPFWMQDIKAIAAFNLHYGFDVQSIAWRPIATSLKSLVDSLATEQFNPAEERALNAYRQALLHLNIEDIMLNEHITLAKIILFRLRDAPALNHKCYRTAVDLTLPLFTLAESKNFFLNVVREFYPIWISELNIH
jgi:hypothetical protein